jgi:hypothetical protein
MTAMGNSSTSVAPRDQLLDGLLGRAAATFSEFVLLAGGKHPTELLQALMNYAAPDPILQERARALIVDAKTQVAGMGHPQVAGLALPHPIDAEWRFTDGTADDLLETVVGATGAQDAILLMGVPSVVVAALHSKHDRRFAVLGEPNIIADGLRDLTADDRRFVHGVVEGHRVTAAILDPPWYLDQFRAMLGEASLRCDIGGHVFVSAPPEGVRPSIPEDLRLIDEAATRCGLTLVSQEVGALRYRTPLFELNALRASGVGAWLPDWRRGNFAVYRKDAKGAGSPSVPAICSGFEVTLSGVRLRLLNAGPAKASAELVPIHDGEIFPSVSMRAPRRSEAALWTSGNRAFSVEYSACLTALAAISESRNLLPKGLDPKLSLWRNSKAIDRIEHLIQKLIELADREFAEAATVLGPTAWETAVNDARFLSGSRSVFR